MDCSKPCLPVITSSWSLLKLMPIELVMSSNHLILCHPLLLPSICPSTRVFSNESVLHIRWPKYRSFIFIISPSSEYSGLISFRIDWFDLFAVHGALKSLLQHHSSKASILWYPAFFIVLLKSFAQDLLKEVAIIFITSTSSLEVNKEGIQPRPSTENWIKDF